MQSRQRLAEAADIEVVAALREALWPGIPKEESEAQVRAIVAGTPRSTLPLVVIVAEVRREIVGFVEVGLRSHADGCDPSRPVGFVEGWYVRPGYRGRGVGHALILAAEDWSRSQGCVELASDTWIDNEEAQRAHEALGFEVVDRCVNYRKTLRG